MKSSRRTIRYEFDWVFFALSSGLVLAILGLAYFWHRHEVNQLAQAWLIRATELQQQHEYESAVQYLSQYVNLCPGDPEGHVKLAKAFDQLAQSTGQTATAVQYYYRALGVQSDRADLRRRLAELLLGQGRFADANREARTLLQASANDAQGMKILALSKYFPARIDNAADWPGLLDALIAAQKANPTDVQLAVNAADVLRNRLKPARPDDADHIIDQVVEASSHSTEALLARSVYRQQFNLPGADTDLKAALEAAPSNPKILLAAANLACQQQRWDDAKDLYNSLTKIAPEDPRGFSGLADLYREQKETDRALQTLQSGLAVHDSAGRVNLGMLWELGPRLADLFIDQRRLDDADKQLQALEATLQKQRALLTRPYLQTLTQEVNFLRAKYWVAKNHALSAIAILEGLREPETAAMDKARGNDSPVQVQWLLAKAWGTVGRWDQSALIYERLIARDPNNLTPRLAAAQAWFAAGQYDAAVRQFEVALASSQVPQEAWPVYCEALLQQQLQLPTSRRNWSTLDKTLAKLSDQGPAAWRKPLLQSKYFAAIGKPKLALTALRQAEQTINDDAGALREVAEAYVALHANNDADRVFEQWEKGESDPTAKALFRADLFSRRGDDVQAVTILQDAMATIPESDRWSVRHRMAQLMARAGQLKEAHQEFVELTAQQPRDLQLLEELTELSLDTQNLKEAEQREQQLQTLEGENGTLWRWFRARRLLQLDIQTHSGSVAEVQRLVNELESRRPAWRETYILRAELAQHLGHPAEAIAAYQKAIALGDRRTATLEHLATQLYESGQINEASQLISQASDAADNSATLSSLAIAISLRERNIERATELANDWVRRHPDDSAGYLRLGQTKLMAKQNAEAEQALRRASELAPHDQGPWRALIRFYVKTDQPDAARSTIAKLDEQVDLPDTQKMLLLGECWEAIGDLPRAEVIYRQAAQATPDDPSIRQRLAALLLGEHRPEAKELLEQIESTAKTDDANRNLAQLLATRDDQDSLNKAINLLDKVGASPETDASDRRLRAAILVRRGRTEDRKEAEKLLTTLVDDPRSGLASDRILLSKLYEIDGLEIAAREQLQALVNRAQPDLSELAVYVDFLLRHGLADEAERWIQRCDETTPGSFTAIALQARWLNSQHRSAEIQSLVESGVSRQLPKLTSDSERSQFALVVGNLFETVGMPELAIKYYRQAFAFSSSSYAPLVAILATHQQMAEAVQICRDVSPMDSGPKPAIALATAMLSGEVSDAEFKIAEPFLTDALRQFPSDIPLLLALSGVHFVQGHLDDVIQLNRQVLTLDPRNLMALNNLSTLLAEQPVHLAEAALLIDRALQMDAQNSSLLDTKAMILFHQGQVQAAAVVLDPVLTKTPVDGRYHFHRAVIYERMHDLNRARESLVLARANGFNVALLTPAERSLLTELEQAVAGLGISANAELAPSTKQ